MGTKIHKLTIYPILENCKFWGVIYAECKTDISAVLTVTSGPDPHMMSKLESHGTWRRNLVEVATSCFGGMAIPCWQDCYPVFLIGIVIP